MNQIPSFLLKTFIDTDKWTEVIKRREKRFSKSPQTRYRQKDKWQRRNKQTASGSCDLRQAAADDLIGPWGAAAVSVSWGGWVRRGIKASFSNSLNFNIQPCTFIVFRSLWWDWKALIKASDRSMKNVNIFPVIWHLHIAFSHPHLV